MLLPAPLQHLRQRWLRWLTRDQQPRRTSIVLDQRRIYIFASTAGIGFVALLLAMLSACINYELSLGYVLTFLLGSLMLVTIFHTFRNLLGLEIRPVRAEPVFAGDMARFELSLHNPSSLGRQALNFCFAGQPATRVNIPGQQEQVVVVVHATTQRGQLAAPRVVLDTFFPLGWFRAWTYLWFDLSTAIYPAPEQDAPPLPPGQLQECPGEETTTGNDEFDGFRHYQPGDTPRRIAWKQYARQEQLYTKTFHGEGRSALWLDYDQLPSALDQEAKLSRLTAWVIQAEALHQDYGMRLPQRVIPPGHGTAHYQHCLTTLALFGEE